MPRLSNLALLGLPLAVVASPSIMRSAPVGEFGMFAYGEGISGAPIFTAGDVAYLGNPARLNDTEAALVKFTTGKDDALIGSPNVTEGSTTPSWSNKSLFVPGPSSSSHDVGFTNSTPTDDISASGFSFYGMVALHLNSDGLLETLWYAAPTEDDRVWKLEWNQTGDDADGKIMVTMKATPPSRPMEKDRKG